MKNINKKQQGKILWGIFIFTIFVVIVDLFSEFFGLNLTRNSTVDFLKISLPVLLLTLHSFYTLNILRGSIFILIALLSGFLFEIVGMKYGIVFGGHYVYQVSDKLTFINTPLFSSRLMVFDVPLLVPLFWSVFIYLSYSIVSAILFWNGRGKPSKHGDNVSLLTLLIFLDGLIIVTIDIFMDPIQVKAGNWFWLKGGPFYDIPIGNFVGWFLVAMITTGIFRALEYFFPQRDTEVDESVFLMPIIGYVTIFLILFSIALRAQLYKLSIIGFLSMLPVIVVNAISFINSKKNIIK